MSQGYIGLHLQQSITNELNSRKISKDVLTLVSQTIVDEKDPSFKNPTKPIGSFYSEEEAKAIAKESGVFVGEDSGRGWRIMVPSPKPIKIYQEKTIKLLLENDNIVIAGGGGGIPTLIKGDELIDIDAVIDKDFTAAKIAEVIDADIFMILTAEDGIWKNFGKEDSYLMKEPKVEELQSLVDAGEFPAGSMRPKVEAVIEFINASKQDDSKACITSLERAADALEGKAGSWTIK